MSTKPPRKIKFPKISEAAKKGMVGNKNAVGNEGGGMVSSYKPEYAKQAYNLCMLGATAADLGRAFDVTDQTILKWKKKYPEFGTALKTAKEEADNKVVRSLFERATGYKHKSVKIFQHQGTPVVVDYVENFPPDVTAAMWWLKNRQPMKWRDRPLENQENDATPASVSVNVVDSSSTDADADAEADAQDGNANSE